MNICIIVPAFPGGRNPVINIFIYKQAKELVNRGYKVFVIGGETESRKEGNMVIYARPNAVSSTLMALKMALKIPKESFWLLKNIGIKGSVGRLALAQMTVDLLEKEKIDIIDGHYADYGSAVAYLVSKIHKIKYTVTCHGGDIVDIVDGDVHELSKGRKNIVSKTTMDGSCGRVIVPSHSMANDAGKYCPKEKISIVYNSADLDFFKPATKNPSLKNTILNIGSVDKRKGQLYLLEAATAILKKHSDINFLIVGKGNDKQKLEQYAKELGISDKVRFLDFLPEENLPTYYSSCKFFVSPTTFEGLPVALIEALACGTPIVSTNIPSVQETVADAGILVEPKNSQQLAEAMLKVLDNEDLRQELSKKAIAQSKKFSLKSRIDKVEKIYKGISTDYIRDGGQ